MNKIKILLTSLLLLLTCISVVAADLLKPDGRDFFIPIGNRRKSDINQLKNTIIGHYGDHRNSHVQGHRHAGIDIQGHFNETVYAIGTGTVIRIFREFPHKTIYIQHHDRAGVPFCSVYIHIEKIQVNVGDAVTEHTPIARIFNREELEIADFGTPPHLHFEIRHNINDNGNATFESMSISGLNIYCKDPLTFFTKGD